MAGNLTIIFCVAERVRCLFETWRLLEVLRYLAYALLLPVEY